VCDGDWAIEDTGLWQFQLPVKGCEPAKTL
jgi:hypothetical protein